VTLRARLFTAIVAAVLISTVLTVGVAELLLHHRAEAQALRTLSSDAAVAAASPLRAASGAPRPRAARRALLRRSDSRGAVFSVRAAGSLAGLRPLSASQAQAVLDAIPTAATANGHVKIDGRQLLYAARSGSLGRIVLVRSARLGEGDAPSFALSIVVVGLVGVLLAALLAWLLARRWTDPLRKLAAASAELPSRREPPNIPRPSGAPSEILTLVDTFNEMGRELVYARDAQRDFLLSASHELKSPISAICGYAEGIQDRAVEPDEAAGVILTEARRLERLVRDLLDLARLDRREFAVVREPVKLASIAATLLERYETRARELGVALLVDHLQADPVVWGDPGRLLQAASNLVENALRVSPSGSAVELELRAGALAVSDRGPGLAPEELDRAFERFYLHRRHSDPRHDGAGLGLAIVSELMSAMSGKARAEPRDGGGTRFVLTLEPFSGGARSADEGASAAGSLRPGSLR
jgi:two-component system, OmpR family, sensor kinase